MILALAGEPFEFIAISVGSFRSISEHSIYESFAGRPELGCPRCGAGREADHPVWAGTDSCALCRFFPARTLL